MGNKGFAKFFNNLIENKKHKFLFLGPYMAGKTTILYKMKLGKVIDQVPIIGFNIEIINLNNSQLIAWDTENYNQMKKFWRPYYKNTDTIIYVVDSSYKERIQIAKNQLYDILHQEQLKNIPLLILANKQDMKLMSIEQITQKLELININDRDWHIQGTCGLTGEGLQQGFIWIKKVLSQKNQKK